MNKNDLIKTITERALPAFAANQFITPDDVEMKSVCASLIEYKVLRALYEICQNSETGLTLEDCAIAMQSTPELLNASEPVVLYTMENFIKNNRFNFNAGPLTSLIDKNEPGVIDGMLRWTSLFEKDRGELLIDLFFLSTEVEFYYHQLNNGKTYTWKEYITEVNDNRTLLDIIQNAFYDGIKRMDFQFGWLSDELEEVQFLREPIPEEE